MDFLQIATLAPRSRGRATLSLVAPLLAVACSNASHSATADAAKSAPVEAAVPTSAVTVLQEHLHLNHDGLFTDPALTRKAAALLVQDKHFDGTVDGTISGELLFVENLTPGVDAIFLGTWTNHVTALSATTGEPLWDTDLGPPVNATSLSCPQPTTNAYGIESTPVIDLSTRTLYVESYQVPATGSLAATSLVYALDIDDGSIRKGWPVDIGKTIEGFNPPAQHTRAGLALVDGTVYVPYASTFDACPDYHGWVIGISATDPTKVTAWSTSANRGGIWGGIVSDGKSLFVSTGNTAIGTTTWGGGEAVVRLPFALSTVSDYFAPSNWQTMDREDLDLGSASPVLFDLPSGSPSSFVAAIGKEGVLHLLDRTHLGGIGKGNGVTGEGLVSAQVIGSGGVHGRIATYSDATGRYVVIRGNGNGVGCPGGGAGRLVSVLVQNAPTPKLSVAWCTAFTGAGSPIVTTTDGESEAVVWALDAETTNQLLAWDADTGAPIFTGGGVTMPTISRWESPLVAKGRIYAPTDGRVYAFAPP